MMNRTGAAVAALLVLAGCGPDAPGDAAVPAAAPPAAVAVEPAAMDTVPRESAAPARAAVVLAPDGVSFRGGPRLAFGEGQARVLADARAALGDPAEQGLQQECPAGALHFAQWTDGVQLIFQDSAFVGWAARPGSAPRTAAGIGPGSTMAEVRTAYPSSTVQQTSLGTEFSAGDLYGIMDESGDTVDFLYAGINCIFR